MFEASSSFFVSSYLTNLKILIVGFGSCCISIRRIWTKDFGEHARLCDALLHHYSEQFLDRRVYWSARNRASYQKDILCVIVDSFDKSKISLPKYPYNRVPKRTVYEMYNRTSAVLILRTFLWLLWVWFLIVSLTVQLPYTSQSRCLTDFDMCALPWPWVLSLPHPSRGNVWWVKLELGMRFSKIRSVRFLLSIMFNSAVLQAVVDIKLFLSPPSSPVPGDAYSGKSVEAMQNDQSALCRRVSRHMTFPSCWRLVTLMVKTALPSGVVKTNLFKQHQGFGYKLITRSKRSGTDTRFASYRVSFNKEPLRWPRRPT